MVMRWLGIKFIILCLTVFSATLAAQHLISVEEVKAEVEKYIQQEMAATGYAYQIEWIDNLKPVRLNESPDQVVVTRRGGDMLMSKEVLQIRFYKAERVLRSVYFPIMLHVFGKVWQTTRAIPADQEISAEDVQLVDTDLSLLNHQPLMQSDSPVGTIAARPLKRGAVIYRKDVRQPYLIKKGETVSVYYKKGSLKIQLDALAMQNGAAGDIIWVKNPISKKRLKVRVEGENLAVLP
ncbi:MAG: hypothetical protein Kow0037_17080 [Calditrichia bacterium]